MLSVEFLVSPMEQVGKVTLLGLEPEKKPWTNLRKLQLLHQLLDCQSGITTSGFETIPLRFDHSSLQSRVTLVSVPCVGNGSGPGMSQSCLLKRLLQGKLRSANSADVDKP